MGPDRQMENSHRRGQRAVKAPGHVWLTTAQIAIVGLVLVTMALFWHVDRYSHPDVEIPDGNRHNFARIAILMDGTRSVGTDNFTLIKEIVENKIIPNVGPNDVAIAYDVQPHFSVKNNAVFGLNQDQMPQISPNRRARTLEILGESRGKAAPDPRMYNLIGELAGQRERVQEIKAAWAQLVQARAQPTAKGSDICSPLRDLAMFLQRADGEADRWLFVLSDLLDDTTPERACHLDEPFPEAHVRLIYPFGPNNPAWKTVEEFWKSFFGEQEIERVPFSAALTDDALLPPNPTTGLEQYDIKSPFEYARPFLAPLAGLALLVAVSLITARMKRHSQSATPGALLCLLLLASVPPATAQGWHTLCGNIRDRGGLVWRRT